jgi:hypothetical protein
MLPIRSTVTVQPASDPGLDPGGRCDILAGLAQFAIHRHQHSILRMPEIDREARSSGISRRSRSTAP